MSYKYGIREKTRYYFERKMLIIHRNGKWDFKCKIVDALRKHENICNKQHEFIRDKQF